MRGALFNTSSAATHTAAPATARTSPPMPPFEDQYYGQYSAFPSSAQRFNPHSAFAAPAGPAPPSASALLAAADSLTSYAARPSWSSSSTGSQHGSASDYDSPNGTPYSEYAPPLEQDYYMNTTATSSQGVAYPESSQRTHVSDATYSTLYSNSARYYSPASTGPISPRTSRSPEEELASYQFTTESHNPSPVMNTDSALRGHGSWGDYTESPASYERMSSSSYSRSQASLPAHLSSLSAMPARPRPTPLPSHQDVLSALGSRAAPRGSPTLPAHLRMHGSLGEPGNPALVPPLVYDGEEYDDESEGSPPSAGGDVYRSSYHPGRASMDDGAGSISASSSGDNSAEPRSPTPPPESALASPRMGAERGLQGERTKPACQKKSKMHQCNVCQKWFPRPSGLATHMNSHSGAKPYKCPIPNCTKSFAVRSNAKRHLRTHGIFPSSEHPTAPSQFTVGFDAPIISEPHDVGKMPSKLRWVPQSLATRTNVEFLRDAAQSDSDEEYPPSCPVLSVPLPAVVPSSPKWAADDFEDRNSYEDMGASPYLDSHQWRALPGPAIVNPSSL